MYDLLKSVYKDKKVFLTGHTGFKGSWMLKLLSMLGAEVRGYSLRPENEFDLFNIINKQQICDSVINDLRNRDVLFKNIIDFDPDFVFHLAAQPLVRLSYQIPSETFEVNAVGTANVLDGVRMLSKKVIVVLITTDKVYHNYEWVYPYRENDRLGGYDPYSASKACTELVIDSYKQSFFNKSTYALHGKAIAVARAGNVIGGGDWAKDRLLPDIVRALSNNKEVVIRNPDSIRPWQHVLEPVVAYLLLGAKLLEDPIKYAQAYNIGPYMEDALTVEEIVKISIENWNGGKYKVINEENQLHEASLLKLDITKIIEELKWKPKMNSRNAVKSSIQWYKEYTQKKGDMNKFTEDQIVDYFNLK